MIIQRRMISKDERDAILQTINEAFLQKGMDYVAIAADYEVRGGDFWVIVQKEGWTKYRPQEGDETK